MVRASSAALLLLLAVAPVPSWPQESSRPDTPASRPSLPTSPRECRLSGRVLIEGNMKAAEMISVRILHNSVPTELVFTDSVGRFESRGLLPGSYTVEISVEGYRPVSQPVDLTMFCRTELPLILLEREVQVIPTGDGAMVSTAELLVPDKARKAFERGMRELHDKNRPERSLEHFQEAISIYPTYDLAYLQLGLAFAQQGNLDAAETNLEKCTELNKQNARAYVLLGMVHARQNRITDSLRMLREAVRVDKTDWVGHFELGRALARVGLLEDAVKHAERAHQLKPDTPDVHILLYDLSVRRRDYPAALAEAREFLELFPQNPLAAQMQRQEESLEEMLAARPR